MILLFFGSLALLVIFLPLIERQTFLRHWLKIIMLMLFVYGISYCAYIPNFHYITENGIYVRKDYYDTDVYYFPWNQVSDIISNRMSEKGGGVYYRITIHMDPGMKKVFRTNDIDVVEKLRKIALALNIYYTSSLPVYTGK